MRNIQFRRITSKGRFIPEVDGIRFFAIAIVVLFHLHGFLAEHLLVATEEQHVIFHYLHILFSNGNIGVSVFFMLSGFILGKPFANAAFLGKEKVRVGQFYLRRLTRLEPPYIIIMTALLIGKAGIIGVLSWEEGWKSYLASLTYTHNFFYGREVLPLLNGPAWSLEVEFQFYFLAPLFALLFRIKDTQQRRGGTVVLALLFMLVVPLLNLPFLSLLDYFQFFLIGFLLADIYVKKTQLLPKTRWDTWIGVALLLLVWQLQADPDLPPALYFVQRGIQLLSIFLFLYYVIIHQAVGFLSHPLITSIGGMCYTIYLLHYPIFSFLRDSLLGWHFTNNMLLAYIVYACVLLLLVLGISALFYLLIERPCMDKNWPQKLYGWFRKRLD